MWKNVIGQECVKKMIRQSLETGKLPSAYLFTGAEGIGKDAMAIELAKALNCLTVSMNGLEACDECAHCKQIASLGSPLLQFIVARAKAKSEDLENEDEDKDVEIVREQLALKAN